jgi:transglutaminase/protease-like cytokinesis protein 3
MQKPILTCFFWALLLGLGPALPAQGDYRLADRHAMAVELRGYDLERLTDTLTAPFSTELEQVRAIFTWITTNIRYDCGGENRVEEEPEETIHPLYFTKIRLENIFKTRRTRCEGYALLFKTMTNLAGIRSTIVEGYGRTGGDAGPAALTANHAWNAVCIDGEWQVVDVTWASGSCTGRQFLPGLHEEYFLMTPAWQNLRHVPMYDSGAAPDSRIRY